jgi:MYXO-CTERM domain-containing protein
VNIALWIVSSVLALGFAFAGVSKLTQPKDALVKRGMAYVDDLTHTQVRLIGTAEVLGALGLILPQATGIAPVLTPVAALGFAVLMVGAALTHRRRREMQAIGANAVLFALAVFVAVGRFAG